MAKPVIGIVANFSEGGPGAPGVRPHARLNVGYFDAIQRAGGLAVILPPTADPADIEQFLDAADGVLFGGGNDIDPARYGQTVADASVSPLPRRLEDFIFAAISAADRRADLPALGICLGAQVFNVARGGTLHQHLPLLRRPDAQPHRDDDPAGGGSAAAGGAGSVTPGGVGSAAPGGGPAAAAAHGRITGGRAYHTVAVEPGSRLARAVGAGCIETNSGHHQAIDRVGRGLVVSGRCGDGVIEAVEDPSRPFFLAVQWHPEELLDRREHLALFEALVVAAGKGKRLRIADCGSRIAD